MKNPLKDSIEIIKTASPEEVKRAQKQVACYWNNVYIPKHEEGKKAFAIFLEEIRKFDEIKDIDHQIYFINTLKWPLWAIGEEHFEEWTEFILNHIQHPSGKIRQAIIRASNYLVMDVADYLRADKYKQRFYKNQERFVNFVDDVKELLEKYDEPKFHRYKYISSIPTSVYKSLQKLLVENLLRSEYYESIYFQYKYTEDEKERRLNPSTSEKEEKEWVYYYDAMEYLNLGDTEMARFILQKAIKLKKDFVAGYMGLTAVAKEAKNREEEKEYADLAFEKTQKVFPVWPEELLWGFLENRQYLRAICDKACVYHSEGNLKEAEKLYRLLLKLNPSDNQGVRYLLAGLFAGLKPEDIDDMFDEGNKRQDWSKLEKLAIEQNKKYHFWVTSDF